MWLYLSKWAFDNKDDLFWFVDICVRNQWKLSLQDKLTVLKNNFRLCCLAKKYPANRLLETEDKTSFDPRTDMKPGLPATSDFYTKMSLKECVSPQDSAKNVPCPQNGCRTCWLRKKYPKHNTWFLDNQWRIRRRNSLVSQTLFKGKEKIKQSTQHSESKFSRNDFRFSSGNGRHN